MRMGVHDVPIIKIAVISKIISYPNKKFKTKQEKERSWQIHLIFLLFKRVCGIYGYLK